MKKEDLISAFKEAEPSEELKERTKIKMFEKVVERDARRKARPAFTAKISSFICAAMACVLCVTAFGIQKFSPHVYSASFDENALSAAMYSRNASPFITVETHQFEKSVTEDEFRMFLSGLSHEYRAIGIKGTVISETSYLCRDEDEYKMYGFAILNVKVSDIFYSENEPVFGIKKGDTVSLAVYFQNESDFSEYLSCNMNECSFFAYSGKGMIPFDAISEKIGLKNAFVVFH